MRSRLAREIAADIAEVPAREVPKYVPRHWGERIAALSGERVLRLAYELWEVDQHKLMWAAAALLDCHAGARSLLRWRELERLGSIVDTWWKMDTLAFLAGPAWREGRISNARVHRWARSRSRWWRRTALVCTVYLNVRARGGAGDAKRTLAICEMLAGDRDAMVVKAMSWALRALIPRDRKAVERFLERHKDRLAALVKREVRNKLTTGLKNPGKRIKEWSPGANLLTQC